MKPFINDQLWADKIEFFCRHIVQIAHDTLQSTNASFYADYFFHISVLIPHDDDSIETTMQKPLLSGEKRNFQLKIFLHNAALSINFNALRVSEYQHKRQKGKLDLSVSCFECIWMWIDKKFFLLPLVLVSMRLIQIELIVVQDELPLNFHLIKSPLWFVLLTYLMTNNMCLRPKICYLCKII